MDVCAKLRGILGMRKIGHAGTLDPMAEGVLPVALGRATKDVDRLGDGTKTYRAVMLLGVVTDTQDITGSRLSEREVPAFSDQDIKEALLSFAGTYDQLTPMYSARKVNFSDCVLPLEIRSTKSNSSMRRLTGCPRISCGSREKILHAASFTCWTFRSRSTARIASGVMLRILSEKDSARFFI